ncbi:hypothetical protein OSB04_021635 [Centaurea solstitialis]|uniref:Nuclear transport factor 2 n=1 Tax=Centaurea solstitialis TaxID=347529 RepID=A0AA38W6X7_9ASTR|nr:hypothetical protein OSB04_021635 [Centaurea solstitialis]
MVRKSKASKVQSLPSIPETNHLPSEHRHSAQDVAEAFVPRYYDILYEHPEEAHKFYKDHSVLSRPNADGSVRTITTVKGIDAEIRGSDMKDCWTTKILSMYAQDSLQESVFVGITGVSQSKDNAIRYFSQNFLLAPQTNGFYVLNDFYQFIDEVISPKITGIDSFPGYLIKDCVQTIMKDKCISTEDDIDEINQINANSSDTKNSLLPNEQKNSAPEIAQSVSSTDQEDVKKESYASIVAKNTTEVGHKVLEKELNHKSSSTGETSGVKDDDDQPNSPDSNGQESGNRETYASIVARQSSSSAISATPESSVLPPKQVPPPRYAKTVLIKDIPPHLNRDTLTKAIQDQLGSLKQKNIHIRGYEDGYSYAFVEFYQPKCARQAVQIGSIKFDGWECPIEPKKPREDLEPCCVRENGGDNGGGISYSSSSSS